MKYEIVELQEMTVAGLTARTNNAAPNMGAVIGGLWERFYQDGIYNAIEGKRSGKALGIYTDYAGTEMDDYNIVVACEVDKDAYASSVNGTDKPLNASNTMALNAANASALDAADKSELKPKDLVVRTIPAGKYAKFIVIGDMHKAVAEFWSQLWAMDLPRAFVCDFEEYQNEDMEHSEIHIYIGLKE